MKRYALRASPAESDLAPLASYPPLLQELLFQRGITEGAAAERFLAPDYENHFHDPFLMKGMERAVERILLAIQNNERTVIWSDYDADGIPGAVALHDFFKKIGFENFENYIPHRADEGFGLNLKAIEEFGRQQVKLLITIDSGTADIAEVARAQELGIDVIVTDHHEQNGTLPPAYAILNHKQKDCPYPEKVLCGSGVVWKLIQAILQKNRFGLTEGAEKWFLDMIGLATLSDMVPLTGENRLLGYYGLMVLRKSSRAGLLKLFSILKINQRDLTEDDIGFSIAPRINAASRMGDPTDAFRLLSTTDEVEAGEVAAHLHKINDERKGIVAAMVKEIKRTVSERYGGREKKVIGLGNPKWRPSLLGLAANSLAEEHGCPVFLWGRERETVLKGSCRSDGSVSLVSLMQETRHGVFVEYGGHSLSGGFTLSNEKVHFLEEELELAYEKVRSAEAGAAEAETFFDKKLSLDEVSWETYRAIERLAPFGVGNPKPLFLFEGVSISGVERFGKEKNHLKLNLKRSDGKIISAMSFFTATDAWGRELKAGDAINLAANLEKSTFRNFPELRLRIVDILPSRL